MEMEFANKVVLITGASAGIGAATAEQFAKLSANLSLVGRNEANLKKVAQVCEESKVRVLPIVADVANETDVERIVRETIDTFGRLDVLVNNAGFAIKAGVLDGLAPFDSVMATNVRGVYQLTGLVAPHLIETKGNIVNVSSVASSNPVANSLPYRISKSALDMFTKCVAIELAPYGVRVNSVNPGATKTQFAYALGMNEEQYEEHYKAASQALPLQRVSDADEMADMIVYLAGHRARGMTGSIVVIDNGHLLLGANFLNRRKNKDTTLYRLCT